MADIKAENIRVKGKVQGVFYRKSTQEKARELGLSGTVENLADGTVRILAQGEPEKLEKLREWCRQGSERAEVSDVDWNETDTRDMDDFEIIR